MKNLWREVLRLAFAGALASSGVATAAAAPAMGQPETWAEVAAGLAAAHLAEPLVATGPTSAAEDAALLRAVERWDGRASADDFSSLTGFLAAHPHSAWRVAVLTDLGLSYLHLGYFSRALDAWGEAWQEGQQAQGVQARALVDRAFGELVRLDARLGHEEQAAVLLTGLDDRPIVGSASEMVQEARDTLWVLRTYAARLPSKR